jgi:LmbE family N-acetylglucosaminyl deacetylase
VTAAPLDRLESAIASGARCLFLSPHLDDAVLSCGALLRALAPHAEVRVLTVFTETTPGPHTRAAWSFLRQCAHPDADTLFDARRAEDRTVLDALAVDHAHLGLPDALFRRRDVPAAVSRLGRVLPELVHRYPTFRYDIALGRVSRGDRALAAGLAARVRDEVRDHDVDLVFCPLGVGRHVDHLLVRALGADHPGRVVYYSDFPYDRTFAADGAFVAAHGLRPWSFAEGVEAKGDLIRGYTTQADALFPTGQIPAVPETYFLA